MLYLSTLDYRNSEHGVQKNAIDTYQDQYSNKPFNKKPVAIMRASAGMLRVASHSRLMFVSQI